MCSGAEDCLSHYRNGSNAVEPPQLLVRCVRCWPVSHLPNPIRPVQRPEVSNSIPVAALEQLVECLVRLLPRELLLLEE